MNAVLMLKTPGNLLEFNTILTFLTTSYRNVYKSLYNSYYANGIFFITVYCLLR